MTQRDREKRRLERQIEDQKLVLDEYRSQGDQLKIDLAEYALNDLLDRLQRLLHVTSEEQATI